MPNKPGPISYSDLKQIWSGDFRAQKWPLEGVDPFILGGRAMFRRHFRKARPTGEQQPCSHGGLSGFEQLHDTNSDADL